MVDTSRFELPLISASQAQKHVTVNEALSRLDALVQLCVIDIDQNTPPSTAQEGDVYALGDSPVDEWFEQDLKIALYLNGGWIFMPAHVGMKAYIKALNSIAMFDGSSWIIGAQTLSQNGAGMVQKVVEYDHIISSGATSSILSAIPASSVVVGVTGRVIADVTGSLSGFSLGVTGSINRYGSGLSLATGSWLRGITGAPLTYYSDEDLLLTAENGIFTAGTLRIAVHYWELLLPRV